MATRLLLATLNACIACNRQQSGGELDAQRLYEASCAKCHGNTGCGGVALTDGPSQPRNFCDAEFQGGHSDNDLKAAIRNGKGAMPPFGNLFDEIQTAQLVAYIRTFNPKK